MGVDRMIAAFFLVLVAVHQLDGACIINSCSKYWENNKNSLAGKCAVLFEDNCCDDDDELYIITNNEANKLRGIGFSGGVGPFGFQDDTESLVVRPGCTLEVWDSSTGYENAEAETPGSAADQSQISNGEKLRFTAPASEPILINDLDDDFDDMNNDIDSFSCKC